MAQPTITFKYNDGTEAAPTWTTIGADKITFTGSGSSNGDLKPIPRPTGSDLVRTADEMWIDSGTDIEVTMYDAGGQVTNSYAVDMFATDPALTNIIAIEVTVDDEAQAGELEAWDDGSYNTTTDEILAGTTNLGVHSQLRAVETSNNVTTGAGAGSMPGAYQSQTAQTATYQLQGSTRKITFSGIVSSGQQNRVATHLFVVDDSTPGLEEVEMTYKYYYT